MIKVIIEDTRQQAEKHALKHEWFKANNIKLIRSKLLVGDYSAPDDMSVSVDTKKDIQEIIGNVTKDHERFKRECELAAECDIKLVVLIENRDGVKTLADLDRWTNPRTRYSKKATSGQQLRKILTTMQNRYKVKFLFCRPNEAAERIIEILTERE
jgi:ribosome-associated protein